MSTEPHPPHPAELPLSAYPERAGSVPLIPSPSRVVPLLSIPAGMPWPDLTDVITDDGEPVDNRYAEKQQQLLVEALDASWNTTEPFLALSNVGLFFQPKEPALVPDMMLAVGVPTAEDYRKKEDRSYFLWVMGKPPDVVVELISDERGHEDTAKMLDYAQVGVPYYVLVDPEERLGGAVLEAYELIEGIYQPINPRWLPRVGLGLSQWQGVYRGTNWIWVRWCDDRGNMLLTGRERSIAEKQQREEETRRADAEKRRADEIQRAADKLRQALEEERQSRAEEKRRADDEKRRAEEVQRAAEEVKKRADEEKRRADETQQLLEKERQDRAEEKARAERLAERLRALGLNPEE